MGNLFDPKPPAPPEPEEKIVVRPLNLLTVQKLIELLKTLDPDLLVVYPLHSEHCMLEPEEVQEVDLSPYRPDGWVHNRRPDKSTQRYVCIG